MCAQEALLLRGRPGHVPCFGAQAMQSRWRWRRLLLIPLLGSLHACDCGSCFTIGGGGGGCALGGPTGACANGGMCASEGTCPSGFQLDTSSSCDDAGTACCNPLPSCQQLGGVCLSVSTLGGGSVGATCTNGTLQGSCSDNATCCALPPGDDSSLVSPPPPVGSCNGAPCAGGCDCEPSDAGGGLCLCIAFEAGTDGGDEPGADVEPEARADADAAVTIADANADTAGDAAASADAPTSDAEASEVDGTSPALDAEVDGEDVDAEVDANDSGDATVDGEVSDAPALETGADAGADSAPPDATSGASCGVILCGAVCTCVSQAMSACVCP